MIQLHDYLQSKPEIIRNGFKGAGIVDCLTNLYITSIIIEYEKFPLKISRDLGMSEKASNEVMTSQYLH